MAVPKKRTGHSAQGKRRSNWKATKPTTVKCPNCGAVALAHTVCTACGTYKGKPVSKKGETAVEETKVEKVEEVKETKETKKTKKSTKKAQEAPVVEDVKTETEAPAEEAKAEEVVEEKTEE